MNVVEEDVLSKAIRMAIANVLMEDDFNLANVLNNKTDDILTSKVLVLKKEGYTNGREDKKRS